MIPKIYVYLIALLAIIAFVKWGYDKVDEGGYNRCSVVYEKSQNKAVNEARLQEKAKQGEINDALKKQYDEANAINTALNIDLDKLRKRPSRSSLGNNPKPSCKGVTGKYLSGEDAGFLTREAARADKIRTALKTCYSYADSVVKTNKTNITGE